MRPPSGRFIVFAAIGLFVPGCIGGGCVGAIRTPFDQRDPIYARLPHHVAPTADATPFRFAMVHDVIHERYPRHGPAFYQERERLARERMAVVHPDSVTAFAAIDDIAVGLARQGQTDEAIVMMRDKLKRQLALDRTGEELYASYANLGEFLVQRNLMPMLGGDAEARKQFEEGRDLLRKSLGVNPKAHFGREEWQLVTLERLLEAGARPEVLRQCDLLGNRLDVPIEIPVNDWHLAPYWDTEAVFGRPYYEQFTADLHYNQRLEGYDAALADPERRIEVRTYIYKVGGETPLSKSEDAKLGWRAPFDEPALWMVGEWRQGSGPSPHLAHCLGEIMLRVGQRYLAWTCYERAYRVADQFAPQVDLREFLRTHCRSRQSAIEKSLPKAVVETLRPKFDSELAFGEAYQREYQAYTDQKIQAGASLSDPNFFDEFNAGRPPIASRVGSEEWYAGARQSYGLKDKTRAFFVWGLFVGGACLLLGGLAANWRWRPRPPLRVTEVTPPPSPAGESPPASSPRFR